MQVLTRCLSLLSFCQFSITFLLPPSARWFWLNPSTYSLKIIDWSEIDALQFNIARQGHRFDTILYVSYVEEQCYILESTEPN